MPATTEDTPSVFVMDKVAWASSRSVSVALTVAASVAPAVAVFSRVPVAEDLMAAATVYVTNPPTGRFTESLIEPVPDALKPVAPPEPAAVQLSEPMAGFVARGSVTDTPVAVDGPELEATIV